MGTVSDDPEELRELWSTEPGGTPARVRLPYPGCEEPYEVSVVSRLDANDLTLAIRCTASSSTTQIVAYNPAAGTIAKVVDSEAALWAVAMRPDHSAAFVATAGCNGGIMEIRGGGTSCARSFPSEVPILSPTGDTLFYSSSSCGVSAMPTIQMLARICAWRIADNQTREIFSLNGSLNDMVISLSGRQIAVASSDGLWLVDVPTGSSRKIYSDEVFGASFAPDESQLAITRSAGLWDAGSRLEIIDSGTK